MYKQDDIYYNSKDKMPDLKSWKTIKHYPNGKRYYEGLSSDFDSLPTYCSDGSIAICIDTKQTYYFDSIKKKWNLISLNNNISSYEIQEAVNNYINSNGLSIDHLDGGLFEDWAGVND